LDSAMRDRSRSLDPGRLVSAGIRWSDRFGPKFLGRPRYQADRVSSGLFGTHRLSTAVVLAHKCLHTSRMGSHSPLPEAEAKRSLTRVFVCLFACLGCGPAARNNDCTGADCMSGTCKTGDTRNCYTGAMNTENVGPCHGGMQSCTSAGAWGDCMNEVVPAP